MTEAKTHDHERSQVVGGPVLKRVIPVAALAAVLAIFRHRIRNFFTRSKA
jgi:hypothetical protein